MQILENGIAAKLACELEARDSGNMIGLPRRPLMVGRHVGAGPTDSGQLNESFRSIAVDEGA